MKKYYYIAPWILQKIGYCLSWIVLSFFVHLEIHGAENIKDDSADMVESSIETLLEDQKTKVGDIVELFQKTLLKRKIGKWKYWYFNGKLMRIENYSKEKNKCACKTGGGTASRQLRGYAG